MSDVTATDTVIDEAARRTWFGGGNLRTFGSRFVGRAGIVLPFLATFLVLAVASSSFRRFENLANILDQQSAIIIVAAAMTVVLIAGGIDLSVGAVYGLCGAFTTQLVPGIGVPAAVAVGILLGLGIGLVNGILVTRFKINALIGTLAMTYVVGGIGALATKGNLVVAFDHPEFQSLAASTFFGITSAAWIMIIVAAAMGVLRARTTFGRYVYASGGNAVAARMAGVRVDGIRVSTFVLAGGAAALAGILDASRVLSAQSSQGGFLTFTVLAGVVVGGTSILGGEGAIWRTVVGCLFIGLVGNGFNLLGLDPFYQQITLGIILLLAVGIDAWSRRFDR